MKLLAPLLLLATPGVLASAPVTGATEDRLSSGINAARLVPDLTRDARSAAAANTAALRAAITRCGQLNGGQLVGGSEVVIPPGRFFIDGTLELPAGGCSGLRGLNGTATLIWAGAPDGRMIQMHGSFQRLTDLSLLGDEEPRRPINARGVVGVWMFDSGGHNHYLDKFARVSFQYLSIAVLVDRPEDGRGQNEGVSLFDCYIGDSYIGILVGKNQSNADYWSFYSTYWNNVPIGVYVAGKVDNWTFIGCVHTDRLADPYSAWVATDRTAPQTWGNLTFLNCQTELVQWTVDLAGRYNVNYLGAGLQPTRVDDLEGTISTLDGLSGQSSWSPPGIAKGDGRARAFRTTIGCTDPSLVQVTIRRPYIKTWDVLEGVPVGYTVTACDESGATVSFAQPPPPGAVVAILTQGAYTNGVLILDGYASINDLGGSVFLDPQGKRRSLNTWARAGGVQFASPDATVDTHLHYVDRSTGGDEERGQQSTTLPQAIRLPRTSEWAHRAPLTLRPTRGDPVLAIEAAPTPDGKGTVTPWQTGAQPQGFIRIEIDGKPCWVPFFSGPTSP